MTERRPYDSPAWKAVRRVILERDGHACRIRLPKCRGVANSVDHIVDWRDGGAPYDPLNLRAACMSCQVSQRNRRVAARARAQRGEPTPPDPEPTVRNTRTW